MHRTESSAIVTTPTQAFRQTLGATCVHAEAEGSPTRGQAGRCPALAGKEREGEEEEGDPREAHPRVVVGRARREREERKEDRGIWGRPRRTWIQGRRTTEWPPVTSVGVAKFLRDRWRQQPGRVSIGGGGASRLRRPGTVTRWGKAATGGDGRLGVA